MPTLPFEHLSAWASKRLRLSPQKVRISLKAWFPSISPLLLLPSRNFSIDGWSPPRGMTISTGILHPRHFWFPACGHKFLFHFGECCLEVWWPQFLPLPLFQFLLPPAHKQDLLSGKELHRCAHLETMDIHRHPCGPLLLWLKSLCKVNTTFCKARVVAEAVIDGKGWECGAVS